MRINEDFLDDLEEIILEVCGLSLKEFINSSVDFRKLLPGLNVKVEVISDEI